MPERIEAAIALRKHAERLRELGSAEPRLLAEMPRLAREIEALARKLEESAIRDLGNAS